MCFENNVLGTVKEEKISEFLRQYLDIVEVFDLIG